MSSQPLMEPDLPDATANLPGLPPALAGIASPFASEPPRVRLLRDESTAHPFALTIAAYFYLMSQEQALPVQVLTRSANSRKRFMVTS